MLNPDVNHKVVEDMSARLHALREKFVLKREKTMMFGTGRKWMDVEAGEATFGNYTPEDADADDKSTKWEQWAGIAERGRPESLVLRKTVSARDAG